MEPALLIDAHIENSPSLDRMIGKQNGVLQGIDFLLGDNPSPESRKVLEAMKRDVYMTINEARRLKEEG